MAGRFEVKAGQHKFESGSKVNPTIPILPIFVASKHLCPLTTKFGENSTIDNSNNETLKFSAGSNKSDINTYTVQPEPAPVTTKINTSKVSTPPIPVIDITQFKGHACTVIPPFTIPKQQLPNLSGNYYRTMFPTGKPNGIPYDESHEKSSSLYHFDVDEKGLKISVPILFFGNNPPREVAINFDSVKNTLTAEINISLYPCKLIKVDTGEEIEYLSPMHFNHEQRTDIKIVPREISPELPAFIENKQKMVNSLLNKDGFYFAPKNCNKAGGCTCKIAVIFKVKYKITSQAPSKTLKDDEIYLFNVAHRQDAKHWSEFQSKEVTTQAEQKSVFINGSIVTTGGEQIKEMQLFDTTFTYAHESSHLFGFPDEYYSGGGAVHKMYIGSKKYIDVTMTEPENDWKRERYGNLMSIPSEGKLPFLHAYYYEEYRKIFEKKTGLDWEIRKL